MQRDLIKRTISLALLSMLVFFALSIFISSYFNRRTLENSLINNTKLYAGIINNSEDNSYAVFDKYTSNQLMELEIADKNYQIVKSTFRQSQLNENDRLSEDDLNILNLNKKPYVVDNRMYYAIKLDNGWYLKTSILLDNNASIILMVSLLLLIMFLVMTIAGSSFAKRTSIRIINNFQTVLTHLEMINEGNYEPILVTSEYEEVASILSQISDINKKIGDSLTEVKQERSKLEFIINSVNEGLLVINRQGQIILTNVYFNQLMKLDGEKPVKEMLSPTVLLNDEYLYDQIMKVVNQNNDKVFDYHDESTKKIYQFAVTHVENGLSNGEMIATILITDVTYLREQDRIKSEFISNASHELKTPITAVTGFSELLLNEDLNDEQKRYVSIIYNQAQKMSNIITEFLELSRLENQLLEATFQSISVLDSINSQVNDLKPLMEKSNIHLTIDVVDFNYLAGEVLLDHIFKNLIENAIRYNVEKGEIIIKSRDDDKYHYIDITDTGIGISEADLPYLFDRFYRVDKSRSNNTGGSGLGLSIAKRYCEAIGAKVTVTSELNIGSTFTVWFPKV